MGEETVVRRVLGRVAVGTAVVFGLTVAAPVGVVRDPELPVSWLWSWLSQRPARLGAVDAGRPATAERAWRRQ